MTYSDAMYETRAALLCDQLRLSPYQSYVLVKNAHKYNLDKLIKRGPVLYAPHANDKNFVTRLFFGEIADVIGTDKMLITGQRRIRVHASGAFSAVKNGARYHADMHGNHVPKKCLSNPLKTCHGS